MTRLNDKDAQILLDVVQQLYASALEGTPEFWRKIYQQCSLLVGGVAGGFISTDKRNHPDADVAALIGFDPKNVARAYRDFGLGADEVFMATRSMAAGSTFLGSRLIGEALHRTPLYDCLGRPAGVYYTFGGILENNQDYYSGLYFWRRADQADFDEDSEARLAAAVPHLRQALEVQRRLRAPPVDHKAVGPATLATFQNSRHGIFILDQNGKVLFVNREGERIVRSVAGLAITNGILDFSAGDLAAEVDRLRAHSLGLARQMALAPLRPLFIPGQPGAQPLELRMVPVIDGEQQALLPPGAAFMAVITDPANLVGLSPQCLRGYGLTRAEARLCQALVRTGSLTEAADELHISASTARSHMKHIFTKLRVTSQIQLVTRLVAGRRLPEQPW